MAEFLSREWLDELAARLVDTTSPVRLAVDVIVRGETDARYRVETGPDGTAVGEITDAEPDLALYLDEEGARRLAEGTANAQELLAAGRLTVRGNLPRILDASGPIAALRVSP